MRIEDIVIGAKYRCFCEFKAANVTVQITKILDDEPIPGRKSIRCICSRILEKICICGADNTCTVFERELKEIITGPNTLGNFPKKEVLL